MQINSLNMQDTIMYEAESNNREKLLMDQSCNKLLVNKPN